MSYSMYEYFVLYCYFQSLKKEADWDRGNDEKVGETDYRMPHESVSSNIIWLW